VRDGDCGRGLGTPLDVLGERKHLAGGVAPGLRPVGRRCAPSIDRRRSEPAIAGRIYECHDSLLADQSKAQLSNRLAPISTNFLELMENAAAFLARWLPLRDKHFTHSRNRVRVRAIMFVNAESSALMPIFNPGDIRLRTERRMSAAVRTHS
jgi:hypothetical protein